MSSSASVKLRYEMCLQVWGNATKRIKQWWFVADSGKLVLSVRYGTKVLEVAKGKWAVEVGTEKDLVPTLELLKGAVLAGELDTQIEAAANKLRDGFGG
jgi:hypothetical protein